MNYPTKLIVPHVDAYLSLIFSNGNAMEKSITENFIRCFSNDDSWIDYYNSYNYNKYGVFRGFELTSDYIKSNFENIHLTLDNCLMNHYKLLYNVDTYYINNYAAYHKNHIIHPLFIHNRAEQGNFYICRDYFDFITYSEQHIHAEELDKAFEASYQNNKNYHNCVIIGFKLDENNSNVFDSLVDRKRININKIIYLLKEFIDGLNFLENDFDSYLKNEVNLWVGIHVFDATKLSLERCANYSKFNLSSKNLKFLEHHIFMMNERIRIMNDQYKIDTDRTLIKLNEKVLSDMEKFTRLAFKYYYAGKTSEIHNLICLLESIKSNYREVISRMIEKLEKIDS